MPSVTASTPGRRNGARALVCVSALGCGLLSACSVDKLAARAFANALASSGDVYASDEDPELVAEALPFALKTMESLLVELPEHQGLLLASCSGFTQYAQAFVAEPADYLEAEDLEAARAERERAARLFVRARAYCLRAIATEHPRLAEGLRAGSVGGLEQTGVDDVPLLYWTGATWAAAINVARSDLDLVADLHVANALLERALELDPDWQRGAIYDVLIAVEAARAPASGGSLDEARSYYERALELSQGHRLGIHVTLAESIAVKRQDYREFRRALERVLAFELSAAPDNRLANTLARRRARWLLQRSSDLFYAYEEDS